MEQVRLAVIGAGYIGVKHAELVATHPMCLLVGICDTDPSRRAIADQFGVPFYTSVEALIKHEHPAGAIIATPTSHHASVAKMCAKQSIHVLIEKPIADTMQQAQDIVQTANKCDTRILVGYHRRHNALILKARELIQRCAIGRLVGVSVLWATLKPEDYFDINWHRERGIGGPTLINLVHDLDSLRFICGEITEVYAEMRSDVRVLDVEDSVSISLRFENGAIGTVLASDACPSPWSYEATSGENPLFFHSDENCYHFIGTAGSLAFPTMDCGDTLKVHIRAGITRWSECVSRSQRITRYRPNWSTFASWWKAKRNQYSAQKTAPSLLRLLLLCMSRHTSEHRSAHPAF
jgi:predicted dehydrogenase